MRRHPRPCDSEYDMVGFNVVQFDGLSGVGVGIQYAGDHFAVVGARFENDVAQRGGQQAISRVASGAVCRVVPRRPEHAGFALAAAAVISIHWRDAVDDLHLVEQRGQITDDGG